MGDPINSTLRYCLLEELVEANKTGIITDAEFQEYRTTSTKVGIELLKTTQLPFTQLLERAKEGPLYAADVAPELPGPNETLQKINERIAYWTNQRRSPITSSQRQWKFHPPTHVIQKRSYPKRALRGKVDGTCLFSFTLGKK